MLLELTEEEREEIAFASRYRAGSKNNASDARAEWRRKHGRAGSIDVISVYRAED